MGCVCKPQKLTRGHVSLSQAVPPKGSIISPNSDAIWGPSVKIQKPVRTLVIWITTKEGKGLFSEASNWLALCCGPVARRERYGRKVDQRAESNRQGLRPRWILQRPVQAVASPSSRTCHSPKSPCSLQVSGLDKGYTIA